MVEKKERRTFLALLPEGVPVERKDEILSFSLTADVNQELLVVNVLAEKTGDILKCVPLSVLEYADFILEVLPDGTHKIVKSRFETVPQ